MDITTNNVAVMIMTNTENIRFRETDSPFVENDGLTASQKKQIDARIEEAEKRFKTEKKITLDEAIDGLKKKLRKQYNM